MDSVMFDAFNTQNLNILKTVFAENLEFYHDKGGLTDYKTNMENFRRNFEMNANSALRRELVKGSLEVYPVPGYGAIETGIHRFIHTENGKELIGIYKFTHVWQYKDKEWKVTRVVSVGH
ncbi:nuclear transport factor 2 family protein [Chitinophaga sp. CF118]|uniref:nuclear transport factor 2 family protein n=1 Tax=Chitinophaga sp. CF118 TaxID=1884367 RepID=UPI001C4354AC|nr:nuclear transport factor 2 family protein [Chitinophaga sp. CF118]